MRIAISVLLLAVLATASLAMPADLAPTAPAKAPAMHQAPPADPAVLRQGGDTIADATPIADIPFTVNGTTVGYVDDYDEICPYDNSTSPDVVYTFTPDFSLAVDIDMYGSDYDTKIYVYDQDLTLIACNDDYYADFVSKLEGVELVGGTPYFIVIDGYGGAAGAYVMAITRYVPCDLECQVGYTLEGEPPLQNDEDNAYNDGCGSANPDGFQELTGNSLNELSFCGRSGWFTDQGADVRDTDWFVVTFGDQGFIEFNVQTERELYLFILGPQDCDAVVPVEELQVEECEWGSILILGEPQTTAWIWVAPTTFAPPAGYETPYEFDYLIFAVGLDDEGPVATESRNWSEVKALFR